MLSFAVRPVSRSGAETGGGTTATLLICTREGETSRPAVAGAGGITLLVRVGVERAWSREMRVEAGPFTLVLKDGATSVRSRETLGAGAMMRASRDGATSACSERTLGAGGTIAALRVGAARDLSEERLGAGGTTESSVTPLRDFSRGMLNGAGAITLAGKLGAVSAECNPSAGGGPGLDLNASRLATAPVDEGSLRLGASTTLGVSEPPRATRMVWVR